MIFVCLFVSKAFCETLEDTNYRFQKELLEKQKEVESLKKLLGEKQLRIDTLESRIRCVAMPVLLARPSQFRYPGRDALYFHMI